MQNPKTSFIIKKVLFIIQALESIMYNAHILDQGKLLAAIAAVSRSKDVSWTNSAAGVC